MAQDIIVLIIVLVAILYISRRVYRIFSSKEVECGCAAAKDCSACCLPDHLKESRFETSGDSTPGL